MCSFYTIDFDYLKHLKKYDEKVPNFDYEDHDKFFLLTKGENYANLVAREYEFCKNNIERIQRRAKRVYYFGIDPTSNYYDDCCKFLELEKALDIWKNKDEETNEDIKQEQ